MKRQMKNQGNDLYAARWAHIQAMNARWAFDQEVCSLFNELQRQHLHVDVFWPTGMHGTATVLSEDDQAFLLCALTRPGITEVFIPVNTGNHWYPVVIHKEASGAWQTHQIQTVANGDCGRDTVAQCKLIAQQGFEAYAAAHPHKVISVAFAEPVLKIANPNTIVPTSSEQKSMDTAIRNSLATIRKDAFSYELFKLAESEQVHNNQGIAQSQQILTKLLAGMSPAARNAQIERLASSGLANKASIQAIINSTLTPATKLSINPCGLVNSVFARNQVTQSSPRSSNGCQK